MEPNQKIQELEAQIKLLKNEVHETLLDIRENILDRQNPFSSTGSPVRGGKRLLPSGAAKEIS